MCPQSPGLILVFCLCPFAVARNRALPFAVWNWTVSQTGSYSIELWQPPVHFQALNVSIT